MITGIVNTTVKVFDQPTSASTQVATLLKGNTIPRHSKGNSQLGCLVAGRLGCVFYSQPIPRTGHNRDDYRDSKDNA
jgi:hypothetical protein